MSSAASDASGSVVTGAEKDNSTNELITRLRVDLTRFIKQRIGVWEMNIEFDDFGLEWDRSDGVKHKADYDDLIKAYEQSRWIPVNERLPKSAGTYIVTAMDNGTAVVTFMKWQNRYKRWDKTGRRAYWKVVAWMPLPEPWKGE